MFGLLNTETHRVALDWYFESSIDWDPILLYGGIALLAAGIVLIAATLVISHRKK